MADKRYEHPVNGLDPDELARRLRTSIGLVEAQFPENTGACVFVFDFNGGGIGYIANAERDGMVKALREWLAKETARN